MRQTMKQGHVFLALALVMALCVGVEADTITYDGPVGGSWNAPSNWDLNRCPIAGDEVQILGGTVYYHSSSVPNFTLVYIDEDGGSYGAIWHLEDSMSTDDMRIGRDGEGWHWMEADAHLTVNDNLYVGHYGSGEGNFYMACNTSGGLSVGGLLYVGYACAGNFTHVGGLAQTEQLYIGQNDPGTYEMNGGEMQVTYNFVVGNAANGTFEQTGGVVNDMEGPSGLILGLNNGGYGQYFMKGGELNYDHISLAWYGDGFFTQSGGTVNLAGNINIGCEGPNSLTGRYVLNENDDDATLNVGGDIHVGPQTAGQYSQAAGTAEVTDDLDVSAVGELYLSGGTLEAGTLQLAGYAEFTGGRLKVSSATLSEEGAMLQLDDSGNVWIDSLTIDQGTVDMADGRLSGRYTPFGYLLCQATNNDEFNMASGSEFVGILTNDGTFNYNGGDFSVSTLVNEGTFNNNVPFVCARLVNNANVYVTSTRTITAGASGMTNGIENNGNLTMYSSASIVLADDQTLVNNGAMYAGGSGLNNAHITGDVVNAGYLLPAYSSTVGRLHIDGDFSVPDATPTLRIRIGGTAASNYDRLTLSGNAAMHGKLDVRLINDFVPSIGDAFTVMSYGSRSGHFNNHMLPALPEGMAWETDYTSTDLTLRVIDDTYAVGDMNCDHAINFDDITPFVTALVSQEDYEAQYPDCQWLNGDCDGNDTVNFDDINGFIDLLVGQ